MCYTTAVIRQAAKLLDAVNDEDNNVIETFFNDTEKRVEVWNMLGDEEKMIASVKYDEEQEQATPNSFLEKKELPNPEFGFGGSLLPTILRTLSWLIEENRSVEHFEFIFNSELEELRIVDSNNETVKVFNY